MAKIGKLAADNVVSFKNCQGTAAIGTILRLSRAAIVFEVYNPYSIVQVSEVLQQVVIRRGDRPIYQGRAVVTTLVNTGLLAVVSASLVEPWADLTDLHPGPALRKEVENFLGDWSAAQERLEPTYQQLVTTIRNFLGDLSRWLSHSEVVSGLSELPQSNHLVTEFTEDVASQVLPKFYELFDQFEHVAKLVDRKVVNTHKSFVQRELHPLLMCSPYIHRTFSKPLGYAGDYQMVNMIVRDQWEGANTYARIVNSFPLKISTAQAHRNRIDILLNKLKENSQKHASSGRRFRVLNVGCGPAVEIQRFVQSGEGANWTELELLDFDAQALEHAKSTISQILASSKSSLDVKFTRRSIHELLETMEEEPPFPKEHFDLIYCAGLFDYLSDPICQRLVELFYDSVVQGGTVLVTNVHTKHPSRGFMEHILEWTLVLRDECGMRAMAPENSTCVVYDDTTGENLFLEVRKPMEGEV